MARIFISYSRSDKSIIDGLIRQLEAAGHPVWVDRTGIRGGEQWRQEIVEAIESSDVFLLVLSENSAGSDNVRAEIDLAKESRKKIIPINLQPVPIPSSMKYQLAGLQRINCFPDAEYGFRELLTALNEGQNADSVSPSHVTQPAVRHTSKLRNKGMYIGGILAGVVLLSTVAVLFLNSLNGSAKNSPTPTQPVEQSHAVDSSTTSEVIGPAVSVQPTDTSSPSPQPTHTPEAPAVIATLSVEDHAVLDELTTFEELEPLLTQANIRLSEPEDYERTRSYFWGPDAAYFMLSVASLKVIGEQRFVQYIHMDIVEKWYAQTEGSGYADRGPLDFEIVEESLIKAHNDYWGDNATSLDDLLVPLN